MSTAKNVSGTGLAFPIILNDGAPVLTEGWELIKSAIYNILAFEYGKRYFQRDFGAGLKPYLEEPNDKVTQVQMEYRLNEQLELWDNRIALDQLSATQNDGRMDITVIVTLRNSNPLQTETFDYTL